MERNNFPGGAEGIEIPTRNSETRPREGEAAAGEEAGEETGGGVFGVRSRTLGFLLRMGVRSALTSWRLGSDEQDLFEILDRPMG